METLAITTKFKAKNALQANKNDLVSSEQQELSVIKEIFSLATYLRKSQGHVLGHAAFTK